jgi:mobilization protein NikA
MDTTSSNRRRTRLVSFRVSDREFEQLKTRCDSEGARSLSDYARAALCRNERAPYDRVDPSVHQLSEEVRQLREHLLHIIEFLANARRTNDVPPPNPAHAARPELSAKTEPRGLPVTKLRLKQTG